MTEGLALIFAKSYLTHTAKLSEVRNIHSLEEYRKHEGSGLERFGKKWKADISTMEKSDRADYYMEKGREIMMLSNNARMELETNIEYQLEFCGLWEVLNEIYKWTKINCDESISDDLLALMNDVRNGQY